MNRAALELKVPKQICSGSVPSYSHLKPFSCIAYVPLDSLVVKEMLMQDLKNESS